MRPLEGGGGKGIPCLCCFDGLKRIIMVTPGLYNSLESGEKQKGVFGARPVILMVDMVGLGELIAWRRSPREQHLQTN